VKFLACEFLQICGIPLSPEDMSPIQLLFAGQQHMTIILPGALGQNSLKAAVAALQDDIFLPSLLQQATSYKAADDICWQFLVSDLTAGQLHGKAICDFDYHTASTDPLSLQLRTCQGVDSVQDKLMDALVATQSQPMFELAVEKSLQVSSMICTIPAACTAVRSRPSS
jgi:hypothetical protein